MPVFTETKVFQSLEIFPALNVINVKHLSTTLKDGVKINEQVEAKSYSTSQFSDFAMDVAPTGGTLAEIVAGFSEAALDAASALPATLAAKNAELAAATTAHTAALAAKDATIAALQAQIDAFAPTPPTTTVTARQIRLSLTQAGLRTAVEMAVAAGDQSTRDWYEYANEFERTNPLVIGMAAALGVSDESLDALFALAATL